MNSYIIRYGIPDARIPKNFLPLEFPNPETFKNSKEKNSRTPQKSRIRRKFLKLHKKAPARHRG